jgi:hypothetical protein
MAFQISALIISGTQSHIRELYSLLQGMQSHISGSYSARNLISWSYIHYYSLYTGSNVKFLTYIRTEFNDQYNGMWPSQWPRGLRHELSSNAGIMGTNPTRGMDVCVHSVCVR